MTVRELIDGLEHLCEKFGNDTEQSILKEIKNEFKI